MKLRIRWDSKATTKREFEVCRPGDEKNDSEQVCVSFSALMRHGVSPRKAKEAVDAEGAWIDFNGSKTIVDQ